jgi:hypothetical protein
MTVHEIVALRCPSCGGGITQPSREMPFGAEFRCDRCGISSVLIIDRALVPLSSLQKQGERVCTACGRVSQREARFCQEGHPLVRRCINSTVCTAEFAVDHQRCDSCGWPQNVKPGTNEAEALAFDRAVADLANPAVSVDRTAIEHNVTVIRFGVSSASVASATAAASAIASLMMDPTFRRTCPVNDEGVSYTETHCLNALCALGPAARQAVPFLQERLERLSSEGSTNERMEFPLLSCLVAVSPKDAVPRLRQKLETIWSTGWSRRRVWLQMLGTISPEDAVSYCRRGLEEAGKGSESEDAVRAAFDLGEAAIPTLERFCGAFSGDRGRFCKAAIAALRNGEKTLSVR